MNLRTNKQQSFTVLNTWYDSFTNLEHLNNELYLIAINNPRLYGDLVKDRRVKIHSIAFGAILEGAKWLIDRQKCYISNAHVKEWIAEKYGVDYKTALTQVCRMLDKKRNEMLG